MTISIDWAGTHIIFVPKADMVQIAPPPNEIRRLDVDVFRLALRNLEDDPDGRPWPKTHDHDTQTTLAGVTYARKVKILAPYTITFEDGQYAVDLYGGNNNIADVMNLNQVSLRSNNSAGLIVVVQGSGITEQDKLDIADRVCDEQLSGHPTVGSLAAAISGTKVDTTELLARLTLVRSGYLDSLPTIEAQVQLCRKALYNRLELEEGSEDNWILYDDDDVTAIFWWNVTDLTGGPIELAAGIVARRIPSLGP